MSNNTTTMYRPCNQAEIDLVAQSDYKKWPPRLAEQPIFYPVTNEQYAIDINAWNLSQFGIGYVTRFEVKSDFVNRYEIKKVGGAHHTEWWIPAEDLDQLNANIMGKIEVIAKVENET